MTITAQTAASISPAPAADFADHAPLASWLAGDQPNKLLVTMMAMAASKKPGKILERLAKHSSKSFGPLRIVSWEKRARLIYAAAYTKGNCGEILAPGNGAVSEDALFQTDLYLQREGEYTVLEINTVAGVPQRLVDLLAAEPAGLDSAGLRRLLTVARILGSSFKDAEISAETPKTFLLPALDRIFVATNRSIERKEAGKTVPGQVVYIEDVLAPDSVGPEDLERIDGFAHALTREGHPGKEEFAKMVNRNARTRNS